MTTPSSAATEAAARRASVTASSCSLSDGPPTRRLPAVATNIGQPRYVATWAESFTLASHCLCVPRSAMSACGSTTTAETPIPWDFKASAIPLTSLRRQYQNSTCLIPSLAASAIRSPMSSGSAKIHSRQGDNRCWIVDFVSVTASSLWFIAPAGSRRVRQEALRDVVVVLVDKRVCFCRFL